MALTQTFSEHMTAMRLATRMARRLLVGTLGAVALVACSADRLNVPNFNNPSVNQPVDRPFLQTLVSGILSDNRASHGGYISDVGIFGRESYNYTQTDGRNTSNYLGQFPIDPAGFASGGWNVRFRNIRNTVNLLRAVESATVISDAEKNALRGFAKTFRALELLYVLGQRDSLGAPTAIDVDSNTVQPFVSRDSVFRFIRATLDAGAADLTAAGTVAMPAALGAGFAGFTTAANFRRFNRAIAARANVYHGTLGCGATCYTAALAALGESFVSSAAGADLRLGVYHPYSLTAGDAINPLAPQTSPDQVAHASIVTDAQAGDARLAAKTTTIPSKSPPGTGVGIATTVGFRIYPAQNSTIPIIRNEELILLRAEANIGLNNLPAALTDINFVRTASGSLPAIASLANQADAITAVLYEKRYSLLWEGHRWVDVRRYGRLSSLPLDLPTHFRAAVQPVPQAECLFRAPLAASLRGPGCP
jgi:starch-binding outer membrane protein, SusD/RagB family